MFITRATRHDRADLAEFLDAHGFVDRDLGRGTAFIARDGGIVGSVRLVEVAPQTVVVEDVVVRTDRRREGIGRRLMQAAMNSRGGSLFLSCHGEFVAFYSGSGFAEVTIDDCPEAVVARWRETGDHPAPPGHVHHYMRAR